MNNFNKCIKLLTVIYSKKNKIMIINDDDTTWLIKYRSNNYLLFKLADLIVSFKTIWRIQKQKNYNSDWTRK
jgi:UDP-glucose 6-dehydrogenase